MLNNLTLVTTQLEHNCETEPKQPFFAGGQTQAKNVTLTRTAFLTSPGLAVPYLVITYRPGKRPTKCVKQFANFLFFEYLTLSRIK